MTPWPPPLAGYRSDGTSCRAFCGCRPQCKKFLTLWRVIECGLLSGLPLRHFQKPLAGMVIRGPGPILISEHVGSLALAGFLIQIFRSLRPFGSSPSHTPFTNVRLFRAACSHAVTACAGFR